MYLSAIASTCLRASRTKARRCSARAASPWSSAAIRAKASSGNLESTDTSAPSSTSTASTRAPERKAYWGRQHPSPRDRHAQLPAHRPRLPFVRRPWRRNLPSRCDTWPPSSTCPAHRRRRIVSARSCYARAATRRARPDEQEDVRPMEVKLGVPDNPKDLEVDIDQSADEVAKLVESALANETRVVLWLTDSRGHRVGIPTDKLAYIEMSEDNPEKRVGFASR